MILFVVIAVLVALLNLKMKFMVTLHMMMYKTDHSFGIGFLEWWTSNSTCLFSLKQNLESEPQNFPSNPTTIYTLGPTEPLVSDDFQIGCRNLKFLHVKTEIWNIKIDSVKIEKKENENETM